MVHRIYKAGQVIIFDEEELSPHSVVVSGVVKLLKSLPDGRQQILGLLFASDFLGRVFSATSHNFAEAVTDVELCCFPHNHFERIVKTHPAFERELLKRTLSDLDDARDWLVALGQKSAVEKVVSFLLRMSRPAELSQCNFVDSSSHCPILVLPLTRSEIADYLGLTIETVSRKINILSTQGLIRVIDSRTIELCDPVKLKDIAESTDQF